MFFLIVQLTQDETSSVQLRLKIIKTSPVLPMTMTMTTGMTMTDIVEEPLFSLYGPIICKCMI